MSKRILASLLAILTLIGFFGCSGKKDDTNKPKDVVSYEPYSPGSWNDSVYENEWLGFTFTLPSKTSVMSKDELSKEAVGNYIYNDGSITSDTINTDTSGIYYDVCLKDSKGIACVMLCIEDTAKSVGEGFISMDSYIKTAKDKITDSVLPFTIGENTTVNIAGTDYVSFTAKNDYISHTYYIAKHENTFASWVITTYTGQKASLKAFMDGVTALD